MVSLIRTVIYVALMVGIVLVFLPGPAPEWSGLARPRAIGVLQVAGGAIALFGGGMALWCILVFGFSGRGTPLPFDPPRRLVTRGPYRYVRNPMALGVGLSLAGAALFYQSRALLGYSGLFFLVVHLMIVLYEEPTLRRTFGSEYEAYRQRVRRWWPIPRSLGDMRRDR